MADGDGTSAPAAEPQPKDGQSVEARLDAQDAKIDGLGTKIDHLAEVLTGGPKASSTSAGGGTAGEPSTEAGGLSVAEQVRQGVEKIEAEKQAKAEADAKAAGEEAWRKDVESRLPERRPSELATGRKARLQERMFGKADAR